MKLAASNIAWETYEDDAVAALLVRDGFEGVELAPTKWRENPYAAAAADVAALRRAWNDRGLAVASLQALLFGRPELQLFADERSRAELSDYLLRAIDFAALLGAGALVFGSPRNRRRETMPIADANRIAVDFFRAVAPYAAERGCSLCIEANPPEYGCDFVTTTAEAIALVRDVSAPGIAVNLDVGAILLSHEDARAVVCDAAGFIGHVHASEPQLVELTTVATHVAVGAALRDARYDRWVSIEMKAGKEGGGGNLRTIERAVRVAMGAYRESRDPI